MANALTKILEYKRDEVAALKAKTTSAELQALAKDQPAPRGFAHALTQLSLIHISEPTRPY